MRHMVISFTELLTVARCAQFVFAFEFHFPALSVSENILQGRLLESMRECLSKDWAKEDEVVDLRTVVKEEK